MNPAIATILEGARLNALLIAVLELDLCSLLHAAPRSAAQLASAAGVSLRGCQALADGMVGLRLWAVEDGVYRNTKLASEQLVRGTPDYIGDGHPEMFRYWLGAFERTAELVRSGEPAHAIDSPETLRFWSFLTPVLARKGKAVPVEALGHLDLQLDAPRLVDVGGGAAALYSRTFLEAFPEGLATQVDWPTINEKARAACVAAGCADRFQTIDADFHDAKIPEDAYDVAGLS
jgi:hypothetical protein